MSAEKEAIPRVLPKIAGDQLRRLSSLTVWRAWCKENRLDPKTAGKPHSFPVLAYTNIGYYCGDPENEAYYLYPDDVRAMMGSLKL